MDGRGIVTSLLVWICAPFTQLCTLICAIGCLCEQVANYLGYNSSFTKCFGIIPLPQVRKTYNVTSCQFRIP